MSALAYSLGQPPETPPDQERRQIAAADFAENAIDAIPEAVHAALNRLYPGWFHAVFDEVGRDRLLVLDAEAERERMGDGAPGESW